jgi:membrane-associated phospholipid phosphatase
MILLALFLFLTGCGTMGNSRRWGEDATLVPGWSKIGESAYNAVTSPRFYVPAAAALLLSIGNADERISDWAMEHTPVFGSMERAGRMSDDFRSVSSYAMYLSMLLAPSGDEPVDWAVSKLKGALVQHAAFALNREVVDGIKAATGRERPNGDNHKSFPSGHAANVAAFTNLASRNVDAMNIPQGAKTALDVGMYALAAATAWARVEAGAHYPTDVLAGMAQGYFITSFINDAFLGTGEDGSGGPVAGYDGRRLFIGYSLRF